MCWDQSPDKHDKAWLSDCMFFLFAAIGGHTIQIYIMDSDDDQVVAGSACISNGTT